MLKPPTRGYQGSRSEGLSAPWGRWEPGSREAESHDLPLPCGASGASANGAASQPKWALKQPRWWFNHRMSIEFHEPWEIEASFMDFMAIQPTFSVDFSSAGDKNLMLWRDVEEHMRFEKPWDCCCTKMSLDPRFIDLYYTYVIYNEWW